MNDMMPIVRALIGLIAAVGIGFLIANAIMTGRDIPGGLLGLLTFIVGAVFGVEAIRRGKGPHDDD